MDKQPIKPKKNIKTFCTFVSWLPVLADEARQHVCGLQLLCELHRHGHFIELRCLDPNYTLRAFLVVNRHKPRASLTLCKHFWNSVLGEPLTGEKLPSAGMCTWMRSCALV